jgi:hypothetical protein
VLLVVPVRRAPVQGVPRPMYYIASEPAKVAVGREIPVISADIARSFSRCRGNEMLRVQVASLASSSSSAMSPVSLFDCARPVVGSGS